MDKSFLEMVRREKIKQIINVDARPPEYYLSKGDDLEMTDES